jgi:hypothetical protein
MNTFQIYKAIPDINPNAFGFTVDPEDANRIWCFVRNTGTFSGQPGIGLGNNMYIPPNNVTIQGCPEAFSFTFEHDNKLRHLTVGYVVDRFQGNTNGKGAAFGILSAAGVPLPQRGPLLRLLQWLGAEVLQMDAKTYSPRDVPSWWTSTDICADGT